MLPELFRWLLMGQVDSTSTVLPKNLFYFLGFRILCEKKGRAHLLRVNCLGKLLSDHSLPVNLSALCSLASEQSDETALPAINNFGDVCC